MKLRFTNNTVYLRVKFSSTVRKSARVKVIDLIVMCDFSYSTDGKRKFHNIHVQFQAEEGKWIELKLE